MIYTITFNPAIDYIMHIGSLEQGQVNRSNYEYFQVGGKGINVSVILKNLGIQSVALGYVSGFTGKAIEEELIKRDISTDFIHLQNSFSRINVKLKSENETEINGKGPEISQAELKELYTKLDKLKNGDTLVLAGSISGSLPQNIYETIMSQLNGKGIRFVVDATKDLLLNVLQYKPFLIKPNNYELSEIFGKKLEGEQDIIFYAKELQKKGAVNVLISMAEKGSVLIDENGIVHTMKAAQGKVVNSVGAGDSMVAGFIAGYEKTKDYDYALMLGTASGGATAFSENLGTKEEIEKIMAQLQ